MKHYDEVSFQHGTFLLITVYKCIDWQKNLL